jgi:hypothetical protein
MRWEYKTIEFGKRGAFLGLLKVEASALSDALNKLGSEGWELVNSVSPIGGGNTSGLVLIFKRPR